MRLWDGTQLCKDTDSPCAHRALGKDSGVWRKSSLEESGWARWGWVLVAGWVLQFSAEVTRDTQTIPREPQKGLKNTGLLEAPWNAGVNQPYLTL